MIQENSIIEPNAKNTKCCIQVAIDETLNIYAQVTNTKRLKRKWVKDNLTNKLIKENSLLKTDMHPLYDLVAVQTKCKLKQVKHNASKEGSYYNLKNVCNIPQMFCTIKKNFKKGEINLLMFEMVIYFVMLNDIVESCNSNNIDLNNVEVHFDLIFYL